MPATSRARPGPPMAACRKRRERQHKRRTAAQETRPRLRHRRRRYPRAADGAGAHHRRRTLAGAAVQKLFENGAPKPVITDPGNELMLRMMRATLGGENVAPEYAPLMREEMG